VCDIRPAKLLVLVMPSAVDAVLTFIDRERPYI
jgi:hypothetical protein